MSFFTQRDLEQFTAAQAKLIREGLPKGVGFCLMMFDFGAGGFMAYSSNAQRDDMIKAINELIAWLEAGKPQGN